MDEQYKREQHQDKLDRQHDVKVIMKARKNPVEWIKSNPESKSLRRRINAKCYDCMGNPQKIRDCAMQGICYLWEVRPYQNGS